MRIFMKKFFAAIVLSLILSTQAFAATEPTFDLEQKIAYQQGQFGALYAHCGSGDNQAIIGGSLASWRKETFMSYNGTSEERANLQKAFDQAAIDVTQDATSCRDWMKQASATWRSIIQLSQYGTPMAANE